MYESIVPNFDLGDIPDTFIKLGFYPGVLQLCLAYAKYVLHSTPQVCLFFLIISALDPANRGLKYYYSDSARRATDGEGERLYNERRNCYSHIIKVFDKLRSKDDVILTQEQQMEEELAIDVKNLVSNLL